MTAGRHPNNGRKHHVGVRAGPGPRRPPGLDTNGRSVSRPGPVETCHHILCCISRSIFLTAWAGRPALLCSSSTLTLTFSSDSFLPPVPNWDLIHIFLNYHCIIPSIDTCLMVVDLSFMVRVCLLLGVWPGIVLCLCWPDLVWLDVFGACLWSGSNMWTEEKAVETATLPF
jgi:hypothetical protein